MVLIDRQIIERTALLLAEQHQLSDDPMRRTERHALPHEVIRHIRRIREAKLRRILHPCPVPCHGRQHILHKDHRILHGIHRIERELLILLHILIIGKRQSLHHRQEAHQRPIHAAGLATDQLRDIRILLLRHDARARRILIRDLHELILVRVPDTDLLAETAEVHLNRRKIEEILEEIITV